MCLYIHIYSYTYERLRGFGWLSIKFKDAICMNYQGKMSHCCNWLTLLYPTSVGCCYCCRWWRWLGGRCIAYCSSGAGAAPKECFNWHNIGHKCLRWGLEPWPLRIYIFSSGSRFSFSFCIYIFRFTPSINIMSHIYFEFNFCNSL